MINQVRDLTCESHAVGISADIFFMNRQQRIDEKIRKMALSRVRYVISAGVLAYVMFSIMHAVFLKGEIREVMLPLAISSSMGMGFLSWYIRRPEFDISQIHPVSLLTFGTFTLNSGMHMYMASEVFQSTNLMLCILGAGVFFNKLSLGLFGVGISLLTWLIAVSGSTTDPLFAHFTFGIVIATVVGIAFNIGLSGQAYSLARKEVEFEDRELLFAAMSKASTEAVLIIREKNVIIANENMTEMLGFSDAELSLMNIDDLFSENIREASLNFINSGESGRIEVEMRASGGRKIPVAIAHKPLNLSGEPVTALAVRSLLDPQEMTSSNLESGLRTLAAGVAHEINNPLTIIYGHIAIISKIFDSGSYEDPRVKTSIQCVTEAIARISGTIGSLMSFASTSDNVVRPVSIDDILAAALSFMRQRFSDAGVMMQVANRADGILVPCRGQEIPAVLIALLSNSLDAVRSFPNPTVALTVMPHGESLVIRVIDSGNGIPAQIAAKMFTPFYTTKAPGSGQGLSLSVARKNLRDHGGTIEFVNNTAKTTFEVVIPIWNGKSVNVA